MGVITINMEKARNIWREKLAIERDARIHDLNSLYHVYIDEGVDPAPVVERRKQIRMVTEDPAIEAAKTVEELKAVWPEYLSAPVAYPLAILKNNPKTKNK